MPVYPTIASQFNDAGVNRLFVALCERLEERWGRLQGWRPGALEPLGMPKRAALIPGERIRPTRWGGSRRRQAAGMRARARPRF